MRRIGLCVYTERLPKGTSRKRRRAAWRTFRLCAALVNHEAKRMQPQMDAALRDYIVFGRSSVHVTWDPTIGPSGDIHVVNVPPDVAKQL